MDSLSPLAFPEYDPTEPRRQVGVRVSDQGITEAFQVVTSPKPFDPKDLTEDQRDALDGVAHQMNLETHQEIEAAQAAARAKALGVSPHVLTPEAFLTVEGAPGDLRKPETFEQYKARVEEALFHEYGIESEETLVIAPLESGPTQDVTEFMKRLPSSPVPAKRPPLTARLEERIGKLLGQLPPAVTGKPASFADFWSPQMKKFWQDGGNVQLATTPGDELLASMKEHGQGFASSVMEKMISESTAAGEFPEQAMFGKPLSQEALTELLKSMQVTQTERHYGSPNVVITSGEERRPSHQKTCPVCGWLHSPMVACLVCRNRALLDRVEVLEQQNAEYRMAVEWLEHNGLKVQLDWSLEDDNCWVINYEGRSWTCDQEMGGLIGAVQKIVKWLKERHTL